MSQKFQIYLKLNHLPFCHFGLVTWGEKKRPGGLLCFPTQAFHHPPPLRSQPLWRWGGRSLTLAGVSNGLYLSQGTFGICDAQRYSSTSQPPLCTPLDGSGLCQPEDPLIWWLLTIPPLAPRHAVSFDGVTSHHGGNLLDKMRAGVSPAQPNLVLRTLSCTLEHHHPFPLPLSKQLTSHSAFHLYLSGVSQTPLTVSPELPETLQALQEVWWKCLSLGSKKKHRSLPLPINWANLLSSHQQLSLQTFSL